MSHNEQKLHSASQAISTAVLVVRMELPVIEQFLKECRDMENYGHIVDPTLYRDSERKAVSALLKPLFEAAQQFVSTYDVQIAKSKDALAKVNAA